jgi:molecular chaperone GrpE (heat shock protein)
MIGKIIDIVETGYSLGEKILRYPKVVVANWFKWKKIIIKF